MPEKGNKVRKVRLVRTMAKVTSKYQVTMPKKIAESYSIRPGDEIDWVAAGAPPMSVISVPSKRTMPVKSGLPSSSGASAESIHQKISASRKCSFNKRRTGSAWMTSPRELGLRMRIFK